MKAHVLSVSLLALALTACGGKEEHKKAVDYVEEAQAAALAKAPKAEEVKFADHGEEPMGGVGGANRAKPTADNAAHVANDVATAEAKAIAHHGANQADTKAEGAKTDAPAADTAAKDTAKDAAAPADAKPEAATSDKPVDAQEKPADTATATAEAPKS